MRIYDCFTFYNEFELLELRLMALWDVVDYFVIVEANMKHNGEPKDFNLLKRADDFKDFFPKIRYIAADLTQVPFKGTGDWAIEHAQRNAIMEGIGDAADDDLIMIRENQIALYAPVVLPLSLADKGITCPAQLLVPVADFLDVGAIVLSQEFFYYYFDWIAQGSWSGTVLTKRKNLTTPQDMRNRRSQFPRIAVGGGYHFSYMGGADRVIDKMQSIVDGNEFVEQSGGKLIDRQHVEEAMATGKDVYGRQGIPESQFLPYDARNIKLPHIDEFLRKYPHFLREPEKYFND